jgi:hypothetical protein
MPVNNCQLANVEMANKINKSADRDFIASFEILVNVNDLRGSIHTLLNFD